MELAIKEEIIQRDLIFQFNYELTDTFWKAAMKGDLEQMQDLYDKHLDIGLNLQQQFSSNSNIINFFQSIKKITVVF